MNITCLISTKSNITNVPYMFFPYILDLEWRAEFIWILNNYVVQARKHHLFFTSFEVCDMHCKTTGLPYCVKLDRIMLKHDYTLKIWSFLKSFKQNSYALWIKISIFLSMALHTPVNTQRHGLYVSWISTMFCTLLSRYQENMCFSDSIWL